MRADNTSDACRQRSILLLGGSRHQVPAIEAAKRLGLRTVLCDYLPDNPGQFAADVFYQESTVDKELMLSIARKEHVEGVLAFGTDVAASTAAYIAEHMGLPTNPLEAVEILSEKHRFRSFLMRNGFPCPKFHELSYEVTSQEVADLAQSMSMPLVLKPTDSSGSKGVTVLRSIDVDSIERALEDAKEFSRNKTLLLEEYIESGFPRVIGGDVFVVDGQVAFWGIMSCLRDYHLGGLVPVGERWPSGLDNIQLSAVRQSIQMLVSKLGIRFGELNVEIIVAQDGTPFFLELAARAGGNMIPNQLSDIAGIDLVEANVRFAMGDSMDVTFDGISASGCFATYMLHAQKAGIFTGVQLSTDLKPHVYRHVQYVEEGAHVASFDNASKALGVLFLRFDSEEQMMAMFDTIDEHVSISIE